MFDETLIDDADVLQRRDGSRLLWSLATAGAQVRRAVELADDFGVTALAGETPRAVLVATDTPPAAVLRVVTRLCCEVAPALAWHGV
ncbi:MAG: SIS domain-containing protein, partial [Jatrophihabitantaceae bacterium]